MLVLCVTAVRFLTGGGPNYFSPVHLPVLSRLVFVLAWHMPAKNRVRASRYGTELVTQLLEVGMKRAIAGFDHNPEGRILVRPTPKLEPPV